MNKVHFKMTESMIDCTLYPNLKDNVKSCIHLGKRNCAQDLWGEIVFNIELVSAVQSPIMEIKLMIV